MKHFAYLITLFTFLGLHASDKASESNFYLVNNTKKDVHFAVVGANDLLSVKNKQLRAATITTLKPGENYQEHISLNSELDEKPVLLYLYPNPQDKQDKIHLAFDIAVENIKMEMDGLIGDERIYRLGMGRPIYVETIAGDEEHKHGKPRTNYYQDITLQSLAGDNGKFTHAGRAISGAARTKDIKRSWGYELLGQWAQDNTAELKEFVVTVSTFIYSYLQAGNIVKYIWRNGFKGAKDIAKIRSMKAKMERTIGMKLG